MHVDDAERSPISNSVLKDMSIDVVERSANSHDEPFSLANVAGELCQLKVFFRNAFMQNLYFKHIFVYPCKFHHNEL